MTTVVFDWDNTLFPTAVLESLQTDLKMPNVFSLLRALLPSKDKKYTSRGLRVCQAYWKSLDLAIINLLTIAKQVTGHSSSSVEIPSDCKNENKSGQIVLLTAATHKWIKECLVSLPMTGEFLSRENVVIRASKVTLYTQEEAARYKLIELMDFTPEPSASLSMTFHNNPLIIFGDSTAEHMAAHVLQSQNVYHFWFHSQSCMCHHIRQLQECGEILFSERNIFTATESKKQCVHMVASIVREKDIEMLVFARHEDFVPLFGETILKYSYCKQCKMTRVIREQ